MGTKSPRHIHMNTPKIRILQKNNFRDDKIRMLINSKTPRNRSNLFPGAWYCPRHHRAPKRQAGLACRKTTFRHRVCASPSGHHHNCSESTPDKLSEERRVESAVCRDLASAGPRCFGILAYRAMTSMSLGRVVTIFHFFLT